jgi:hypothetical protein
MQRDLWTLPIEWAGNALEGFRVEAADGPVGRVAEATYNVGASYLIVDTSPAASSRNVIVPAGLVERIDPEARRLDIARPRQEILDGPEHSESPFRPGTRHREIAAYYAGGPFHYTVLTTSGMVLGRYEADCALEPHDVVDLGAADRRWQVFNVLGAIATVTPAARLDTAQHGKPLRSARD